MANGSTSSNPTRPSKGRPRSLEMIGKGSHAPTGKIKNV